VLTANQVTIWAALRAMGLQAVAPEQRLMAAVDAPAA
jgi:maleate isomerase